MNAVMDQASGLRDFCARTSDRPAPMIAVASGKGGVGKTFLSVNLSLALAELGLVPLLVDLDWGLANVDVAFGLAPRYHVGHVLNGECEIQDAIIPHEGISILPNGCGEAGLVRFPPEERLELVDRTMAAAAGDRGVVVADTHPGIGKATVEVLARAAITLVVSSTEPTALTDSYALFKVLRDSPGRGKCALVISDASTAGDGSEAAAHLDMVSQRFLGSRIEHWGTILSDPNVPQSIREQSPVLLSAPDSPASRAIRQLARQVAAHLQRVNGTLRS